MAISPDHETMAMMIDVTRVVTRWRDLRIATYDIQYRERRSQIALTPIEKKSTATVFAPNEPVQLFATGAVECHRFWLGL
jgi:hypothetical protein